MKTILLILLFVAITTIAFSQTVRYQKGYFKPSSGKYINGHYKKVSNSTNWDNYSTKGNYDPYNNKSGRRAKDYSLQAQNYGRGKIINTGNRGGQYYYNSNGNKTYVPKRN